MVTRFMGGVARFMGVYEIYGRVYEIYGSLRDLWELRDLWGVQLHTDLFMEGMGVDSNV